MFDALLVCMTREMPGILMDEMLDRPTSAVDGGEDDGRPPSAKWKPQRSNQWKHLARPVGTYCRNMLTLLKAVTETTEATETGATEATDEDSGVRKHRGFIFALIGDLSATLGFVFGGLVPLLLILCFHSNEKHYNTNENHCKTNGASTDLLSNQRWVQHWG